MSETVKFRFFRDFDWLGPNRKCVFCKLAVWAFKKTDTPIDVPRHAAEAAEAAGAGERVQG